MVRVQGLRWLCRSLVLRCCLALRRRVDPDLPENVEHLEWIVRVDGPQVEPQGRHIQYLFYDYPHGLSDRMGGHFRFLVALGRYHNATVHIQGGSMQAVNWLDKRHSHEVANWDRYFDTNANRGNPWHALENFQPCKRVWGEDDPTKLFEDGSRCVNIYNRIAGFKHIRKLLPADVDGLLPVSHHITGAARDFMKRYAVPASYGSIHIRRCDRGKTGCTDPQKIYDAVQQHDHHTTWIIFLYAEPGYAEALQEKLRPLRRRFLFEGEIEFNRAFPLDNYFTYLLGRYLNSKATTILETHSCEDPTRVGEAQSGPIVHYGAQLQGGIFLDRWWVDGRGHGDDEGHDDFEADDLLGAVCDNATRGATLQKDPAKDMFRDVHGIQGREYTYIRKDKLTRLGPPRDRPRKAIVVAQGNE